MILIGLRSLRLIHSRLQMLTHLRSLRLIDLRSLKLTDSNLQMPIGLS